MFVCRLATEIGFDFSISELNINRSRKGIEVVDRSLVNLIVGWMLLRYVRYVKYVMKLSSFSSLHCHHIMY